MQFLGIMIRRFRRVRRVAAILYMQRIRGFDPPGLPFFDEKTLERFRSELARARVYLEYGSGGSTLAADEAGIRTYTVESDRFYAQAVKRSLSSSTSVRLVTPELGLTEAWGMPVFGARRKGDLYVQAPFEALGTEFPDLVLIDGRYRVACALEVARRASDRQREAILIFDDYGDRSHYRAVEQHLGSPELVGRSAVFRVGSQSISEHITKTFASDPR